MKGTVNEQYSIFFDGEPKGKARPRVTKTHTYTPQSTVEYEKLVSLSYRNEAKGKTFGDKPIYLTINAFFSIPKRTSRKNRELNVNKYKRLSICVIFSTTAHNNLLIIVMRQRVKHSVINRYILL